MVIAAYPAWTQKKKSLQFHRLNPPYDQLVYKMLSQFQNIEICQQVQLPSHLEVFAKAIRQLMGKKRFLFRSAASLINRLSNLSSNSYTVEDLVALRCRDSSGKLRPGLVMVGSYVELANQQVDFLLSEDSCVGVELPVHPFERALGESLLEMDFSEIRDQLLCDINDILNNFNYLTCNVKCKYYSNFNKNSNL